MKKTAVVAGIATAFLVLAPGAALAATSTTTPTAPVTSTTPADDFPEGPVTRITRLVTLSPAKALPGAHVKLDFACRTRDLTEKIFVQSPALAFHKIGNWADGTVRNVKPGKYAVTLHCGPEDYTAWLEVLPAKKDAGKQVTKVPAGAPQTGGTDGPVDDSGTPLAAGGAMGVLALGGSGLVLARRARRR